MEEALRLEQIEYGYFKGDLNVRVIRSASGVFHKGRVHAVTGRSGEERTALLSLMAGLERPGRGSIFFDGRDIGAFDRDDWRKQNVGLVLQAYKLVPYLTALENAVLHMELLGMPAAGRKKAALELLEKSGFDILKCGWKAGKLSPSEQQRVILARAVGVKPRLLLVEAGEWSAEPELEFRLMNMLADAARTDGACVILSSNSRSLADMADEVWGMKDGVLLPLKT